jgi:hypothetical protein
VARAERWEVACLSRASESLSYPMGSSWSLLGFPMRGVFAELYKRTDFLAYVIPHDFVQVNLSFSRRGVVRGFTLSA